MKTTLHTRLDSLFCKADPESKELLGVVQECMELYGASYRSVFSKVNVLASECGGNKALLAKKAQEEIYPWIKREPTTQASIQALLQGHMEQDLQEPAKEILWERLLQSPLLDSWTSEYAKSLLSKALGEYNKFKELTKTQQSQLLQKKTALMEFISDKTKRLHELQKEDTSKWEACKTQKHQNSCLALELLLENKHKKLTRLSKSIVILEKRLESGKLSVCFGSKTLLKQNPLHHSQHRKRKGQSSGRGTTDSSSQLNTLSPFENPEHWAVLWKASRDNLIYAPGDAKVINGNCLIQYDTASQTLRLRLPPLLALRRLIAIGKEQGIPLIELLDTKLIKFGTLRKHSQWIYLSKVMFSEKNRHMIELAQKQGQPITMSLVKKLTPEGKRKLEKGKAVGSISINTPMFGYYVHITLEETVAPLVVHGKRSACMGVDFNAKGLAYCVVDTDGNKKSIRRDNLNHPLKQRPFGFIPWAISDGGYGARQKSLEGAIHQMIDRATQEGLYTIAIENLSFDSIKTKMRSGYVKNKQIYNKMISGLPTAAFLEQFQRQCTRAGVRLLLVNPAYSSVGGFTKYGLINGLPVDIAAALWIGRQGVLGAKPLLDKFYATKKKLPPSATKGDKKDLNKLSLKVPQMLMVKHYNERTVFPTLPWAHQRNMPKPQRLNWKSVLSTLKVPRGEWKHTWRTFILQGLSPTKKGKPPKGGRVPVQSVSSSTHAQSGSNAALYSKPHTV